MTKNRISKGQHFQKYYEFGISGYMQIYTMSPKCQQSLLKIRDVLTKIGLTY